MLKTYYAAVETIIAIVMHTQKFMSGNAYYSSSVPQLGLTSEKNWKAETNVALLTLIYYTLSSTTRWDK